MARDIFVDVLQRMSSTDPYIKKKACLCMINVLSKVPELVEDMIKTLPGLLSDEDHGVMISGRNVIEGLLASNFFNYICSPALPVLHPQVPEAGAPPD